MNWFLEQYWFSAREAKVYMTVLELWIVPASSVARRLEENRVTVYSVLKAMKSKGIIYETKKWWTTYYGAITPQQYADQQQAKIDAFKTKIPELEAVMSAWWVRPKMQFFEWEEWIIHQYYDMLTSTKDDIRSFFSMKHFKNSIRDRLLTEFLPKRVKAWIFAKVIMQWDEDDHTYIHQKNKETLNEILIVQEELFDIECQIDTYANNKVSIIIASDNDLAWIIIESKRVYNTVKNIFDLIWNSHR